MSDKLELPFLTRFFYSYGMYDENGEAMGGGGGEQINGGTVPMEEFTAAPQDFANFENQETFAPAAAAAAEVKAAPAAANPFKKDTTITTNPFNQ